LAVDARVLFITPDPIDKADAWLTAPLEATSFFGLLTSFFSSSGTVAFD